MSGRLKLDPARNDFPVTLHDPCNMVRLMGIVEPQREILAPDLPGVPRDGAARRGQLLLRRRQRLRHHERPQLRRLAVPRVGPEEARQVLKAFGDCLDPSIPKYVCAPCSNCKGQFRDMLAHYGLWERHRILYGGLVELIVNAMTDVKPGFIEWEWH